MKRRRTFEKIAKVLEDGSWHEFEELRHATSFPAEWVQQLRSEGVIETSEEGAQLRVRLARGNRSRSVAG